MLVTFAASIVLVAGFVFAKPLLFIEGGAPRADVIVLLGGDPGNRVFKALELFKAGAAPKILLTGRGDCLINRNHLILAGVSSNALIMEPDSRSTRENAEFSARLMKERGMKSAIVVTSWYHCRRALACFSHFAADVKLSSFPTYDAPDMEHKPGQYEVQHVFREYPGLAWYMVRYGISPCCKLSSASTMGQPK